MDRLLELRKHANQAEPVLEIAPYHSPCLQKINFPKLLTLDVFDTEELKKRASRDPNTKDLIHRIEEVNFVGNACNVEQVIKSSEHYGKIQTIISSHNFEHLANPIKFLIGCSRCLRPGGYLTMAIPDYRACFDHFRFPSRLADWLMAYQEDLEKPTPEMVFDFMSNISAYPRDDDANSVGCNMAVDEPDKFKLVADIVKAFENYKAQKNTNSDEYIDAHCNVVTNRTFELLVSDLVRLGLLNMEVIEISEVNGLEFYAHLRKPEGFESSEISSNEQVRASREEMLKEISVTLGASGYPAPSSFPKEPQSSIPKLSLERDRLAQYLRSVVRYPWKNIARFVKRP